MDVTELIEKALKDNGYDGLYSEHECACRIGDLAPCGGILPDCHAGYLNPNPVCGTGCADEHDWHIEDDPRPSEESPTPSTEEQS